MTRTVAKLLLGFLSRRNGSFLGVIATNRPHGFAVMDLSHPAAKSRVKEHTAVAALVVITKGLIAAVFPVRDLTQITQSVVRFVSVDMVKDSRPPPVNHRPSGPMCQHVFVTEPALPVPSLVGSQGLLAGPPSIPGVSVPLVWHHLGRPRQPKKTPRFGLVAKEIT